MNYKIDKSDLNNIKIVSTSNINIDTIIGKWVTKEAQSEESRYLWQKETMQEPWNETDDLGRYTNHSDNPNTNVELIDDCIVMISNKNIPNEVEITVDYRTLFDLIGYIPNINF